MHFLLKNTHIIHRICSGFVYACLFVYVIIQDTNNLFSIFTIFLLMGSLYELSRMISKLNFFLKTVLIIYIITAVFLLNTIRVLENGAPLIILLLSQIWASDVGGYIIGKVCGKNKFSNISPKKTWEGILGSFMFCMLIGYCTKEWIEFYIKTYWFIVSVSIMISCIIGDLIISKLKRFNKKKHSGVFLPGHGGFLDRLDSLFFATFIYYLIICI